jgi:hypothetical protein
MNSAGDFLLKAGKIVVGEFFSTLLGILGGGVCGVAILSFGALIGRSGSTGSEYVGYWEIGLVWLGLLYGGVFGAFAGFLAYPLVARKIGLKKALLPAFTGTIIGGFMGAVAAPPLAVLTGICGFFIALFWIRIKLGDAKLVGNS